MKGKKRTLGLKHSDAAKAMIKAGNLGMKFWNNGTVNVRARECPEGFRPGKLAKRSNIA